jgi:hypothetical protein
MALSGTCLHCGYGVVAFPATDAAATFGLDPKDLEAAWVGIITSQAHRPPESCRDRTVACPRCDAIVLLSGEVDLDV